MVCFWHQDDINWSDDDFTIPLLAGGDLVHEIEVLELAPGQIPPPACPGCGALLTSIRHDFTALAWSTKEGRWDPERGHWELSRSTEIMDYDDGEYPVSTIPGSTWWIECSFCDAIVSTEPFAGGPALKTLRPSDQGYIVDGMRPLAAMLAELDADRLRELVLHFCQSDKFKSLSRESVAFIQDQLTT